MRDCPIRAQAWGLSGLGSLGRGCSSVRKEEPSPGDRSREPETQPGLPLVPHPPGRQPLDPPPVRDSVWLGSGLGM